MLWLSLRDYSFVVCVCVNLLEVCDMLDVYTDVPENIYFSDVNFQNV